MFAIHIASCLVDKTRAVYLARVLKQLERFPNVPIFIGFDIVGLEHEHGKSILPLIQNKNITCFTHTNGLGYSWNHPWTLHNYDLVLQMEDDWDIADTGMKHVNAIHKLLDPSNRSVLIVMKKPTFELEEIIRPYNQTYHVINKGKFIKDRHYYLFSNHPHFKSRLFHKFLGDYLENVPPPIVESTFVNRCCSLMHGFDVFSICQAYCHIGRASINHAITWTGEISRINGTYTSKFDFNEQFALVKNQDILKNCEFVHTDDDNNIYSLIKMRNENSTLILYPNIYMVQDYRIVSIIPFVASFFNKCIVFTNASTKATEKYINSQKVREYFPNIIELHKGIYLLVKVL